MIEYTVPVLSEEGGHVVFSPRCCCGSSQACALACLDLSVIYVWRWQNSLARLLRCRSLLSITVNQRQRFSQSHTRTGKGEATSQHHHRGGKPCITKWCRLGGCEWVAIALLVCATRSFVWHAFYISVACHKTDRRHVRRRFLSWARERRRRRCPGTWSQLII